RARLAAHPRADAFRAFHGAPDLTGIAWPQYEAGAALASRAASGNAIQAIAAQLENFIGGSADLAGSNKTRIKASGDVGPDDFTQKNLHFGVREHGMGSIVNGMSLHGGVIPYCATFLVFHDYMRPPVRLAALMKQPIIYVYTHDSVYLGEDGPTHQPVEHLMACRTIPNLSVMRPADGAETNEAWRYALTRRDGPTALVLTRQGLPTIDRDRYGAAEGVQRGAYILAEPEGDAQVILIATGSEVSLAMAAQAALAEDGVAARVISMPCWEAFDAQEMDYKRAVLPAGIPKVSIEAGITHGWQRYVGIDGGTVGIDRFGASAPGKIVAEQLGLTVSHITAEVQRVLNR
ncbi:MAG: transketolase C-terminal domain-containing protein, partial [Myxococcota bacterium]